MARRPFLRKAPLRAQATRVAQKLSGDLLGKYNFSDVVMDMLHYLTVVCHYSSYLWVRPLDSKAQTFEELASLLRMLEKKYGGVESFRSDNENSIDSEALQKVLHDLAIESDICGIGSAAANGEIERKHRDIGDRTRVELLQSGETPAVLPYVMLHAARMMNCMPRSDGRIPWVLVHGCPVLWELMRQFAHACVVRVVDPGNKLQPRAVRGRFFGMSVDSMTVALIKVQTKTSSGRIAWRVIPSRDFHFLPDPMLPAGTFLWDYVSDHWLPEYDTQGRELFTNKHHECVCAGCKAGGQGLLECDYCELVWHRKCAGVPTGKKIDKLVWRCPACRKNDESVTPIVSKEQRHAAARARNDALAQRRKEEANRVQTKRAVTRAQRNLRRQEHANAAVHALSMQIAYSKHASEAAATKITERYSAEASLKIAAAKETRCLPKGVQQITPAYYAANQTSKRAAGPSEAEMAHFINAADIHADEKHVHLTHLHAGTPYADDAECFDGWLRHLNENGMDVPIGLDGGVYVEMCKADLAAFGELTMDQVPWPKDFEEAKASPYYLSWKDAMRAEVHENLKIGVGLIPKTEADAAGQKLLGTKWVFTTKEKNGHVVFKARLTVRGDQQDPASINNDHRASPTTDSDMIRLILAQLANVPGARFLTFDFVRAYLQAKLPSDYKPVYIRRPQGLHSEFPDGTIFLLGVNMYGLVTAAYLWYKELCSGMERLGWTRGDTDVCMWRKDTPAGPVFVAVHVDDGLLAGFAVDEEYELLETAYKMTVNRNPTEILGLELEIAPDNHGLLGIHQTKYILSVLDRWEKHTEMPFPTRDIQLGSDRLPYNKNIDLRNVDEALPERDIAAWHQLTGDLQWVTTRPEIAFAVKELAKAVGHVTDNHKKAAHELLKYLRAKPSVCLVYGRDPEGSPIPVGTVDSEYGREQAKHGKASYGYAILAKKGLVAAKARTSKAVALSTCEAEVQGLSAHAQHLMKIRNYLRDYLGHEVEGPSPVHEDNKGAVDYARNPAITRGMRHIALRWHYARQLQQEGDIDIIHCPGEQMVADIFTKMLDAAKFQFCCKGLGLMPLDALKEFNLRYAAGEIDLQGNATKA